MSCAGANLVHCPGYADDARPIHALSKNYYLCPQIDLCNQGYDKIANLDTSLPLCQNLSRFRSCWRSRSESATGTCHAKWIELKDKDKHNDKEFRTNAMTEYSLAPIWKIMKIAMMVMTTIMTRTTLPSSQTPSQRSQRLSPPQHTGLVHQGHISWGKNLTSKLLGRLNV